MENAADALKIGFALLVFVVALSIVFTMISKVKATSDAVLYYADDTNYRDHIEVERDMSGNIITTRTVSKSDIISTLYRYNKESISVTIKIDNTEYVFDKGNEVVPGIIVKADDLKKEEDVEKMLGTFITNTLEPLNNKFLEEFVEVPISGEYISGDDGSEIVVSSGGKKVYVTYTYMP